MNTAKQFDYNADAIARLEKAGGVCIINLSDSKTAPWEDSGAYRPHYRVTMKGPGGSYTFDYWGSINDGRIGATATVYDVLACLEWYTPESFEEFCAEFGYDTDSRKAEQTFKACRKQTLALNRLFTTEQIDSLSQVR